MLKLNASYSKKVPADGEYTSQSYHAAVEVELPDGLSSDELQKRIHETFELVKTSVEVELRGAEVTPVASKTTKHIDYASSKQLKYLLDLAGSKGITPQELATRFDLNSVDKLTRQQCSKLIDELNGKAA